MRCGRSLHLVTLRLRCKHVSILCHGANEDRWCSRTPTRQAPGRCRARSPAATGSRPACATCSAGSSAFGEFAGPLVTLLGPRGFGKTVLLKGAQREAAAAGFVPVWVPLSHGTSLLSELTDQVEVALRNTDSVDSAALDRFSTSSRTFGAEVSASLGVVSGKVSPLPDRSPRTPGAPPCPDLRADRAAGAPPPTWSRSPAAPALVILLDEVARRGPGRPGHPAQRDAGPRGHRAPHRRPRRRSPTTPGLLSRAATFAERTTWLELHRLPAEAAAEALTGPARPPRRVLAPRAIALLVHASGGLPHLVQLLGSSVWEATRPEKGHAFTRAEVLQGCTEALEQVLTMFGARWEAATPAERDFLVAMSRYPEPVARGDIARELDRPTQALGVATQPARRQEHHRAGRARQAALHDASGSARSCDAQADESVSGARPGSARDLTAGSPRRSPRGRRGPARAP